MQLTLSATLLLFLGQGAQALVLGTPVTRSGLERVQRPNLCAVDALEEAPEPAPPPPEPACDFPGCVDGRVMGGLAAIELFAWWPIKVSAHTHIFAHVHVQFSDVEFLRLASPPTRSTPYPCQLC